ncbi:glycoside hydrolase family 108 protein [Marinobacterium stanieri]|uniref:glycoside hydrolase family 108 protein n=1 Tax=Marinobacterium stanieri TaxID=49186 RepID=UPI0002558859|nr:glycosyl hydrolase 108 family protein [Marinobacterium stanieri]
MSDTFIRAVNWLLGPEIEGEHSNDPADKGGDTWYGISRNAHPDMPWPPTRDQAIDRYQERYWDACHCHEMHPVLALLTFDAAVQHGTTQAAKFLQRTLGVTDDGIIGPQTLLAAQDEPHGAIFDFLSYRGRFYAELCMEDPSQKRFLRGWMRRLFLLEDFALNLSICTLFTGAEEE